MANPIKGQVAFAAGALALVLVYDFNALVTLEDELGVSIGEIPQLFEQGVKAKTIRTVFRIGLAAHHPGMDDVAAGAIIHEIGPEKAADLIGKALAAAFPESARAGPGKTKAGSKPAGTSPAS